MRHFLIILFTLYLCVSPLYITYSHLDPVTIPNLKISYQGVPGSYSYITSNILFPKATFISHNTFKEAMTTVEVGEADFAVIPIENSNAGRVEDVHLLLPTMNLKIVGEYFLPIQHQLLGIKGSKLSDIKVAYSHPQALAQSSKFLSEHGITPEGKLNTAIACVEVMQLGDKTKAAVASTLAAEMYDMEILASNIQNESDNKTRFIILTRNIDIPDYQSDKEYITSLIVELNEKWGFTFEVMMNVIKKFDLLIRKIESYPSDEGKTQYYIELKAHTSEKNLKLAFQYLSTYSQNAKLIGVYEAQPGFY